MKKLLVILATVAIILPIGVFARQIQLLQKHLFTDANLVSYWRLENTADSKGSNTLTNNNGATFTAGKFGNAATLASASSQSLSVGSGIVTSGPFTYTVWVKLNSIPSTGNFYAINAATNAGTYSTFLMIRNTSGATEIWAFIENGASNTEPTIGESIATGVWHQYALVYDGSNLIIYFDGVNVKQNAYSAGYNVPNQFNIGKSGDPSNWYMDGQIDDNAVFSRALTASEIAHLYTSRSIEGTGISR